MNKEEITKIKRAITLIHYENQHYEGLNILAKLVGWKEVKFDTLKTKSVLEIFKKEIEK